MIKTGTLKYQNISAVLIDNGTEWLLVNRNGEKEPIYHRMRNRGKDDGDQIRVSGNEDRSFFKVWRIL